MIVALRLAPIQWKISLDNVYEEIAQNVLMILLTHKFTVPLDRALGIAPDIIDAPINSQSLIAAEVAAAIASFEPRASLVKIDWDFDPLSAKIDTVVTIDINP